MKARSARLGRSCHTVCVINEIELGVASVDAADFPEAGYGADEGARIFCEGVEISTVDGAGKEEQHKQ